MVLLVTVVADNDLVVISIIRAISIDVMNGESLVSPNTAYAARIISLNIKHIVDESHAMSIQWPTGRSDGFHQRLHQITMDSRE